MRSSHTKIFSSNHRFFFLEKIIINNKVKICIGFISHILINEILMKINHSYIKYIFGLYVGLFHFVHILGFHENLEGKARM